MGEVLTIHEVAAILKKHYRTVLGFIRTGKLRAVKLGKREWSVRQEWLDEFLNVGTKVGTEIALPVTSGPARRHHKSGAKRVKSSGKTQETPWYEQHGYNRQTVS